MKTEAVTGIVLTLLIVSALGLAFNVSIVESSGTIYIMADGSINPPDAPIYTADNVTYTFTENIYDEIVVERDNIIIEGGGYTVQGTGAEFSTGIDLSYRSNVTVKNTKVTSFHWGISIYFSNYNSLTGNIVANNTYGISVVESDYNTLTNNTAKHNSYAGITLVSSCNNTLTGNIAASNEEYGVDLSSSSDGNLLTGNTATNSTGIGIGIITTTNNKLIGNTVTNTRGIYLATCENSMLIGNIATNNEYGIMLVVSSSNIVAGNIIANNSYGISLIYVSVPAVTNNTIYHNNFINNTDQVWLYEYIPDGAQTHIWDDGYPSGGNYWSDYPGVDLHSGQNQDQPGSDGIGDTSYIINVNNTDRYPLWNPYGSSPPTYALTISITTGGTTSPPPGVYCHNNGTVKTITATPYTDYCLHHWELDGVNVGSANPISVTMDSDHTLHAVFEYSPRARDVAVVSVTPSATQAYAGQTVNISVVVRNEGNASETFSVTLYYDSTAIGTETVTDLAPGANKTVTSSWNTTGVTPCSNYTIRAEASVVPGETDIADNVYIDGAVKVKLFGDVNGDRIVNIVDMVLLRVAFGSTPIDPNWNPEADIVRDGVINLLDALVVRGHYWETC